MKPINNESETQEEKGVISKAPYLRTMYFFAIIVPYCFVVHVIFNATTYSTITQFGLVIVLGLAWHTAACPFFYKKLGHPYDTSLLSNLFIALQYTAATFGLFFLVSALSV